MIFFYSNYRKQSFYITTTLFNRFSLLRSEEHTSELQSQSNLVCRLLLEKKKNTRDALLAKYRSHVPMRPMSYVKRTEAISNSGRGRSRTTLRYQSITGLVVTSLQVGAST